jgi:hypothetical protein
LKSLESHLERVRAQYRAAKQARSDAIENNAIVCLQIDWSENYNLGQTKEEKSAKIPPLLLLEKLDLILPGAFFYEQHVSIHPGYAWSKVNCWSFASLSDSTCHMAEAGWASFKELFDDLIDGKKMKKITLISDSPVSQYRNKTTIFLLKKYTTERQIEMRWIFLESGNGKGVADGIGASLKRQMEEAVAFNPDKAFKAPLNFMEEVKRRTDIQLYIYDTSNIDQLTNSLPSLNPVKRTASLHEILAMPDGKNYGKDKSSEPLNLLKVSF